MKKLFLISVFFLFSFSLFAEKRVNLSFFTQYNNKNVVDYGLGAEYRNSYLSAEGGIFMDKDLHLGLNAGVHYQVPLSSISYGSLHLLLGANLMYRLDVKNYKNYMALAPMFDVKFSFLFPFNLEIGLKGGLGYNVALFGGDKGFIYNVGAFVSYSFDVEKKTKPYTEEYDDLYLQKQEERKIEQERKAKQDALEFLQDELEREREEKEYYKDLALTSNVEYVLLDTPKDERTDKEIIKDNNSRAREKITSNANFDGSMAHYVYDRTKKYDVFLTPLNITDIRLKASENVVNITLGDPTMWIAESVQSTEGENLITHILLRPRNINIQTDCMVITDERVYYFNLISTGDTHLTALEFVYPYDEKKGKGYSSSNSINVSDLNFNYNIEGNGGYKPKRVYSDTTRTYIQFDNSFSKISITPTLYLKDRDGEESLVNFSIKGITYIVPLILQNGQEFILKCENEIVRISRAL